MIEPLEPITLEEAMIAATKDDQNDASLLEVTHMAAAADTHEGRESAHPAHIQSNRTQEVSGLELSGEAAFVS